MSDIIKILPDHLANQIAAGEVVQRPSSVVKELMENAIDAHSTEIKVLCKDAGKSIIQVIDNGVGMSPVDAGLSFTRHATSKIFSAEDLFRLQTKGFRGEALASIAAVAQVEMSTRREGDELATSISVEGSVIKLVEQVVGNKGTNICVKNIFFNIPVRRNFLKSNSLETNRIIDEFIRVALAHPELAFQLYKDDALLYNLAPNSLRRRIVSIFKSNTDNKLVPIDERTEVVNIQGFVYKPEYARAKSSEQFLFVNKRYIKSSYLSHAISSAFSGLIPEKYYPGYFLYFDIDPSKIDVNIHPTKTEINFDDERTIYSFVKAAVRHALGQYNVLPALDFEQDQDIINVLDHPKGNLSIPNIIIDPTFNPFESSRPQIKSYSSPKSSAYNPAKLKQSWQDVCRDFDVKEEYIADKQELFSAKDPQSSTNTLDQTQVYQLLNSKYILSHIKTGMLLIDPVRAHWRIMYEKILQQLNGRASLSQQILFAVELDLDQASQLIFDQIEERLSMIGFHFQRGEDRRVSVLGVPVGVMEGQVENFIEDIIIDFKHNHPTQDNIADGIARSLSRSMTIKNASELSHTEMANIATELFECAEPMYSPNGKATFVKIGMDEVDRKFN